MNWKEKVISCVKWLIRYKEKKVDPFLTRYQFDERKVVSLEVRAEVNQLSLYPYSRAHNYICKEVAKKMLEGNFFDFREEGRGRDRNPLLHARILVVEPKNFDNGVGFKKEAS